MGDIRCAFRCARGEAYPQVRAQGASVVLSDEKLVCARSRRRVGLVVRSKEVESLCLVAYKEQDRACCQCRTVALVNGVCQVAVGHFNFHGFLVVGYVICEGERGRPFLLAVQGYRADCPVGLRFFLVGGLEYVFVCDVQLDVAAAVHNRDGGFATSPPCFVVCFVEAERSGGRNIFLFLATCQEAAGEEQYAYYVFHYSFVWVA